MLHLTRLRLTREFVENQKIRDSHDWHQLVWKCFPNVDARQPDIPALWTHTDAKGNQSHRFHLTRLDTTSEGWELLILSAAPPTCPACCPAEDVSWESKAVRPGFLTHSRYRFRVLANPTKKIIDLQKPKVVGADGRIDRNRNARRIPLSRREDLVAWLQRKAGENGFAVELESEDEFGQMAEVLRTVPRGRRYFSKDGREEGAEGIHGVHYGVDFQGVLRVTDPKAFADAFCKGIGSAKGFGFGLLTLVPLD